MSLKEPVIAIIGASGLIGSEIINLLEERNFPFADLKLFASKETAGDLVSVAEEEYEIFELSEDAFTDVDLAIFASKEEISAEYIPKALAAGAKVIDFSGKFRADSETPLILAAVNLKDLNSKNNLIAMPDQLCVQLLPVLNKISEISKIKRVVVSTYQAVSGAGRVAMDELWDQTKAVYSQKEVEVVAFPHQIAFNCIPHIDIFSEDGNTKEELRVINESHRILRKQDFAISCSCVRVPVFNCNAMTVNVETESELSSLALHQFLQKSPEITSYDGQTEYPMPIDVSGRDEIFIGRLRKDASLNYGLNFWLVSDNLRLAALNAVRTAEHLIQL